MLAHAKLSKMTTVYVINRSPSPTLDWDIPQRVWTDKEASYRHLRVYGCLAYVHIRKDQRGKLDPTTWPCILLGYGDDEFGYRLWNLADKKVIRSRDIVFMEEKTIVEWEEKNGTPSWLVGDRIPTGSGQGVGSVEGQSGAESGHMDRSGVGSTEEHLIKSQAEEVVDSESDNEQANGQ